jgi:hypothetical protein
MPIDIHKLLFPFRPRKYRDQARKDGAAGGDGRSM